MELSTTQWKSFGIKNFEVTYQRLMDRVFKDHIGMNIEVYVDGILVKLAWVKNLVGELEETFSML